MMAFIHGGSGSGKSALAENMLCGLKTPAPRIYIATMSPGGAEARARIARHQAARAHKGFATLELRTGLAAAAIPAGAAVLLECLGNLLANELFSARNNAARDSILRGVEHLNRQAARTIIVSNDVFSDGVDYPAETRHYIDVLADLNRTIAEMSSLVVETVCGIPLCHKDKGGWIR